MQHSRSVQNTKSVVAGRFTAAEREPNRRRTQIKSRFSTAEGRQPTTEQPPQRGTVTDKSVRSSPDDHFRDDPRTVKNLNFPVRSRGAQTTPQCRDLALLLGPGGCAPPSTDSPRTTPGFSMHECRQRIKAFVPFGVISYFCGGQTRTKPWRSVSMLKPRFYPQKNGGDSPTEGQQINKLDLNPEKRMDNLQNCDRRHKNA